MSQLTSFMEMAIEKHPIILSACPTIRLNTRDSAGFTGSNGAAEKRLHHRVSLYFPTILPSGKRVGNPECIPNCITMIAPARLPGTRLGKIKGTHWVRMGHWGYARSYTQAVAQIRC